MQLILLPGNSKSNKDWIKQVKDSLNDLFDSIKIHYYQHWKTGESIIDLDYELQVLAYKAKGLDNYIIFAKSAGALLALKGVYEKKLRPCKCIFVGTPILWAKHYNFDVDLWLENYSLPGLFIQKSNDPAMSFKDLKKYLAQRKVKNHEIIEIPGNTHNYEDLQKIKLLVEKFVK